jgi:1,2-diacylglycerol-3-alpha-glucose alpha-1,2-glucosyltransferase
MKVFFYTELEEKMMISGLGKAIEHQKRAATQAGITYTTDPDDDYDILHINTWLPKSYLVALRAKLAGKKIVYHAHSTEEDYRDGFILGHQTAWLIHWWLVRCYSLGDIIVTPSPYSSKLLQGYKGLENKQFRVISNGVDTDYFCHDAEKGEAFRKIYGFAPDDKVIMGIGLYIRRKGITDFVELARRFPEYKFIWFGYSSLKAATHDVREAVKNSPANLTWAGYVDKQTIKAAMSGADLFIFPTLEETEGIPVIEACACGQDAIIRDIPAFEGWLEDGKNIYKAKDVDAFEAKIRDFFDGKLPSLKEAALQVAKERDLKLIGSQLRDVYEEVMAMKTDNSQ